MAEGLSLDEALRVLDHRAASAAADRSRRRQDDTARLELDAGRGADLAAVDEVVASRLQLSPERRRQERGLGTRVRAVALARAGIGDRLRQGHPLVEAVEEDLQDGRDDRRAARRAEREERLLPVEHDRR